MRTGRGASCVGAASVSTVRQGCCGLDAGWGRDPAGRAAAIFDRAVTADIRWIQRLDNLDRAFALLDSALVPGVAALSDLEREGAVHRFEFTFELAWKTIKDFLEYEGIDVDPMTPRSVLRAAAGAAIIDDGAGWIDMLDLRNLLAHTYDDTAFRRGLDDVAALHLPRLRRLVEWLRARRKP